ncbi:DNA repair protein RadC [Sphingobium sp. C100]|jgi:DNA repair protein RadC|uniref:JAB domain-containing protein n=1 Tax=Sphingobium sp. C100 TaxID=1207055 RepID=UPI0003D5A48C|nr:JAB domain-containing protein [Sphingobium sp. C100]ETI63880.1 DNA repair protein RadC [Sphingobium sp. C100]PHQ63016.1 MAG: hypothetical protein COC10_08405 [Sphingobium sp.]
MTGNDWLALTILDDEWRPRRILPLRRGLHVVLPDLLLEESQWIALVQQRPDGQSALPGPADVQLTRALVRSFRPLDLRLADHRIHARDQRFSFRAAGLL